MRANRVVMTSPALDDDLGFAQRVKDLAVEQLIAQTGIEAFNEAILPRAAGGDVCRLCADRGDQLPHCRGEELRPIIGAKVSGRVAQNEQAERRSITSIDLSRRATRMARHSWVNSSMI